MLTKYRNIGKNPLTKNFTKISQKKFIQTIDNIVLCNIILLALDNVEC